MSNKVNWLEHEFSVHEPTVTWSENPGVYIFAGLNQRGRWEALYIGQTISFKDRPGNHEMWDAAARLGATHIHARVVALQASRDTMEAELIRYYQPRLNTQLK